MAIIHPDSTNATDPSAIAQRRAEELQGYTSEYQEVREFIPTGFTAQNRIQSARQRILSILGGTEQDWSNWKWHMHHRHLNIETIAHIFSLTAEEYETYQGAIEYIRAPHTIRDVLLTGGAALTLSDGRLEKILSNLRAIPHVEIIRLSTRLPVTLPQRVTPELCEMLSRYGLMGGNGALWVVTHFNHPIEVTPESAKACLMLMSHGMPILNQSVLLKGINDDKHIMMRLNQELVRIGVN